jgi:hypothetical protein
VTSTRGPRSASAAGTPWGAVPAFVRASNFGAPLAAAVEGGLAEARARLEPCFEAEIARQDAGRTGARPSAGQHPGQPLIVLRLEARLDALEVVGTELERRGDGTEEFIACSRKALAGFTMDAPGAGAGQRYRLLLPLQP